MTMLPERLAVFEQLLSERRKTFGARHIREFIAALKAAESERDRYRVVVEAGQEYVDARSALVTIEVDRPDRPDLIKLARDDSIMADGRFVDALAALENTDDG